MLILCVHYLIQAADENFKDIYYIIFKLCLFTLYLIFMIYCIWGSYQVGQILSNFVISPTKLCIVWQHSSLKWVELISSVVFLIITVCVNLKIEINFKNKLHRVDFGSFANAMDNGIAFKNKNNKSVSNALN